MSVCVCLRAYEWVKNRSAIFQASALVALWVHVGSLLLHMTVWADNGATSHARNLYAWEFNKLVHFCNIAHCLLVRAPINRPIALHTTILTLSPHPYSSLLVTRTRRSAVYWYSGHSVFMTLVIVGFVFVKIFAFVALYFTPDHKKLCIFVTWVSATQDAHVCSVHCHSGC